jgi:hypothetical protein
MGERILYGKFSYGDLRREITTAQKNHNDCEEV